MIYLDNQATTRVDPRVVEAMLPLFDTHYGNSGSITHSMGIEAQEMVDQATHQIATVIGATGRELVYTSGATESNNLAVYGYCLRRRESGHIITVATEHKAVLDLVAKLERSGFEVTRLPVEPNSSARAGLIDVNRFADAIRDDTFFASVMLANNEIGVIQPVAEIARICRQQEIAVHTDATQAVGKIPVDVNELDVDLLSFSAHKFYGPKGIGGLYVRQTDRRIRLASQIDGGGQQQRRRSGTLNVPGIIGMAKALEIAADEMSTAENQRKIALRKQLYDRLCEGLGELPINGTTLGTDLTSGKENETGFDGPDLLRLPGNLNCQFPGIDGHSLMAGTPNVAVSSGSACTAANPEPSHVLAALGLDEDEVRSSIRFGIGRFNTIEEIEKAAEELIESANRLGGLG